MLTVHAGSRRRPQGPLVTAVFLATRLFCVFVLQNQMMRFQSNSSIPLIFHTRGPFSKLSMGSSAFEGAGSDGGGNFRQNARAGLPLGRWP
jgi:hypothetical protein